MKLTVLSVAYPLAPVGPDTAGGAEQILAAVDEFLTDAGHHSIVIACEGSTPKGTFLSIPRPQGPLTDATRRSARERCGTALLEALRRYPVDLVHMHGIDFCHYLPPAGVPVIATLHLPPEWYPTEAFQLERPCTYLHCVSAAQQQSFSGGSLLPIIENGVRFERFSFRPRKHRFLLALGRICPEKGFHLAFDAAAKAGFPILLGGEVFPYDSHQRYFREELIPRFTASQRFLGPLTFRRKRRLLVGARCVLIPSLVAETSSLVAMEALASGTPVIAFPSGALKEIIEDGKTGFLVSNVDEMARAIHAVDCIDPHTCRAAARERFSADRMLDQYLSMYRSVVEAAAPRDREAERLGSKQAARGIFVSF